MLHVSLGKLTGRRPKNVRTRQRRIELDDRKDVLELVAKAEGASRLIKRGPRVHAATERLILQPPVHEKIHRRIRGADFNSGETAVPMLQDILTFGFDGLCLAIFRDQGPGRRFVNAFAQDKDGLNSSTRLHRHADLNRAAGIEAGADTS